MSNISRALPKHLAAGAIMRIKNLFTYWTNQAFSPGAVLKEKYAAFKSLLAYDKQAHDLMAELEEIYHEQIRVDFSVIEKKYTALSACVGRIVSSLNRMHPSRYADLEEFYLKIDGYARQGFVPAPETANPPYCLRLGTISESMMPLVGEKALNLAMIDQRFKLPTPTGYVITTNAFFRFIRHNRLKPAMDEILSSIDILDTSTLHRRSEELMKMVLNSTVPLDVATHIRETFRSVFQRVDSSIRVAVRSSAVGEDSHASFAGQFKTLLNVHEEDLLAAYKTVVASKYSPEALVYRINYGLTDMETPMAVLVVEMIDAAASGVMYTQELDDLASGMLEVHSIFGLGELLVQGEVASDLFKVRKGEAPEISTRKSSSKRRLMKMDQQGEVYVEKVEGQLEAQVSIDDGSVLKLAAWGMRLEEAANGPRDVEWCQDKGGRMYLLQSRPLKSGDPPAPAPECRFDEIPNRVLVEGGIRAASGVASGPVLVALNAMDLSGHLADHPADLPDNAVLVTRAASANFIRFMEKISAVVSETGSAAGHFASVAREFGIPTIVNATGATSRLKTGQSVTVYADEGLVYENAVPSLLTNPCIRKRPIADSPFTRKLDYLRTFVSPLRLVDPGASEFIPGGCRSLHDVVRFAHEAGTREMFAIGERAFGRGRGAKRVVAEIPMLIYLMDVGGGLADDAAKETAVVPAKINCVPFHAVWKGLNHPGIQWGDFTHYNWAEYDKIAMSGGIISAESAQLSSYAVLSDVYLNLNLKFGYHFVILDTLCSGKIGENHILFRFNGGGGDDHGRSLRAEFLQCVLQRLHFDVSRTSDLVDASLSGVTEATLMEKLDQIGRLLGATRLMDMYLGQAQQVAPYVEAFLKGRYHFSTVEMES
jgi:pyruvate,water dikinase